MKGHSPFTHSLSEFLSGSDHTAVLGWGKVPPSFWGAGTKSQVEICPNHKGVKALLFQYLPLQSVCFSPYLDEGEKGLISEISETFIGAIIDLYKLKAYWREQGKLSKRNGKWYRKGITHPPLWKITQRNTTKYSTDSRCLQPGSCTYFNGDTTRWRGCWEKAIICPYGMCLHRGAGGTRMTTLWWVTKLLQILFACWTLLAKALTLHRRKK